jgi:uroporphyrinogen decarboxylase
MATLGLVRQALDAHAPRVSLIGFAGSPFTVACYMVDGRGGKDFPVTRGLAYSDPTFFARLIRLLTEATAEYLCAQVEAGAEVLMLFDSWAGLLSPAQFRRWVIEPTAMLVRAIRKRCPQVPIIGFPRLAGPLLPEYASRTAVQCVGLDSGMEPRWAVANLPRSLTVQGNLDPLALVAGGAALEAEARTILGALRGRPAIFNLGHGIVPQTPPEHVSALIRLVRAG